MGLDGCWENAVPDLKARARTLLCQSLAALAACVEAPVFLDPQLPAGIRQSSRLSLPMLARLHSSS